MSFIKAAHAATIDLGEITGVGQFQTADAPIHGAELFVSRLVAVITAAAGIAFLFYFLTGALSWITAGSDKGKVEGAQKAMTNAAIGLIAVIVSYFIAGIVGEVIGIPILSPAQILQ